MTSMEDRPGNRYSNDFSLKKIGGKALLTRAGHTEERDELIEFLRDDLLKWMTLEEAVAKLQELVYEFQRNPKQNRLKKIVPNMCKLHTDLWVIDAYHWYDEIFKLSTRRHVRPSFADLRHILNFAQVTHMIFNTFYAHLNSQSKNHHHDHFFRAWVSKLLKATNLTPNM